MKWHEWRYVAIAVTLSAGVMLLLDFFVHPYFGAAWIVAFAWSYQNKPILHRTIEKIAGGKEET